MGFYTPCSHRLKFVRAGIRGVVLLVACGGPNKHQEQTRKSDKVSGTTESERSPSHSEESENTVSDCPSGLQEIKLRTDDGVELVADFYPAGKVGAPGVILLHMIPPTFDKSSYPEELFILPLVARGFSVINVNRRGARGSGGNAKDAYIGPKGWLDPKAAYDFLVGHACATPPNSIALVGASNGTTSTLDFTVQAGADNMPQLLNPSAIVFLSPGKYTEAQFSMDAALKTISTIPLLSIYPKSERAWNERIATKYANPLWKWVELDPGDHGTKMFKTDPNTPITVIDFIDDIL